MKKFCPAPWITVSTDVNGSIRPCCRFHQPAHQSEHKMPWMKDGSLDELYNGPEMKKLRQAFLNGEQPEECSWCWKEEAAGVQSFRERYLKRHYKMPDREWYAEDESQYNAEDNYTPKILDFKLSNICNLKCRMCSATASSLIAKENGKDDPYFHSDKIIDTVNEDVFFKQWMPHIKELEMTGGEPFFSAENKKIIHRMVDEGYSKDVVLHLTTNGMFYIPKLLDKVKAFKRAQFAISLDDVGDRLQYARSNGLWPTISKNVKDMTANYPAFSIQIYRTVNIFNIFYLDELDNWANDNNITMATSGLLHEPHYLSIKNMSQKAKDAVNRKYGDNELYSEILRFMNTEVSTEAVSTALTDFRKENERLDSIRNTSFVDTYPEWSRIMEY